MSSLALRTATNADLPFIKHGWLESFRDGRMVRGIPNSLYFQQWDRVVTHLLNRGLVVMAVDADAPDKLHGFLCAETVGNVPVLHYVYVRGTSRRRGVADRLLRAWLSQEEDPQLVMFTADTQAWYQTVRGRTGNHPQQPTDGYLGVSWVYDPLFIFRVLPHNWAGLPE